MLVISCYIMVLFLFFGTCLFCYSYLHLLLQKIAVGLQCKLRAKIDALPVKSIGKAKNIAPNHSQNNFTCLITMSVNFTNGALLHKESLRYYQLNPQHPN